MRAYQISEGKMATETVPLSLHTIYSKFDYLSFHPEAKTSFKEIYANLHQPLEIQTQEKMPVLAYPPLAYLPQALGILLGRTFDLSPLLLMYFGRLINLIFWVFLMWHAIKQTPIFKWLFCLLALSPMSIFEAASLSRDPLVNGASFLYIGLILKYAYGKVTHITTRNLVWLFLLLILVTLPKYVYIVLGLTFLFIPTSKIGSKNKYFALFALMMITVTAMGIGGYYYSVHAHPKSIDYSPWLQRATEIWQNPAQYLELFIHSFWKSSGEYIEMFIGVLGWLDTPLPKIIWLYYGLILILVALLDKETAIKIPFRAKSIALLTFIIGSFLFSTIMFLANGENNGQIQGIQGRYFIPLSPVLLLSLYNQKIQVRPEGDPLVARLTLFTAFFVLTTTCYVLFARYYI